MLEEDAKDNSPTFTASVDDMEQLKRRETELTRLNERLQNLERARTEFFSNISREFRTPLTLLLGPLQDILDSPASALAPDSRAVLEMAQRNALRLLQLVDTLLHFSSIDGARPDVAEPTDLAAFTAALAGNFRSACDGAGLNLVVDCPPLPEPVYVDREVWEKIVLNLIANAFRFTVEGTIEVLFRVKDGNALLTIRDTGTGIPESELPHLFTHFHCVAGAPPGTSGRTGIGLGLVRELVRFHNGSIDVQSTPGCGSTFTVVLPLAGRNSSRRVLDDAGIARVSVSAGVQGGAPVGKGPDTVPAAVVSDDSHISTPDFSLSTRGRVVVVDDNDDMRDYLRHVLEGAGFEVDALPNGTDALAACQARPPDALVSDVFMPGLDGFELIERLRADEHTAMTPVLLLSGRAGEDSRIDGFTAGADDYLIKPVRSRELVARVEGAIRLSRMRRETARRDQADLESLFSMAPDGVVAVGNDGKVITANQCAQQLFGYSLHELVDLQVEQLMQENDGAPQGQRALSVWSRATRLVSPIQELRGVRRDGTGFVAEVVLGPLHFKNQICAIAIVRDITERKKLEDERAEQEKRFRDLSRRLVDVQETERRMLATELHDRTSPNLAAIRINLKLLSDHLSRQGTDDIKVLFDDTAGLLADTNVTIREISSNLRPTALDDGGLLPAMKGYAQQFMKRTGIVVHLEFSEPTRPLPRAVQSSLFRIVQEALTNCAKHSKARNVTIRLGSDSDHTVSLSIADDGVGFDSDARSTSGLGLLTMRERAEFAGASFSVETKPGHGTCIRAIVCICNADMANPETLLEVEHHESASCSHR